MRTHSSRCRGIHAVCGADLLARRASAPLLQAHDVELLSGELRLQRLDLAQEGVDGVLGIAAVALVREQRLHVGGGDGDEYA